MELKRGNAEALAASICVKTVKYSKTIEELADSISTTGIDYVDSLHIASACDSGAEYLITCDDQLIGKRRRIQNFLKSRGFMLKIDNPKAFISTIKHRMVRGSEG